MLRASSNASRLVADKRSWWWRRGGFGAAVDRAVGLAALVCWLSTYRSGFRAPVLAGELAKLPNVQLGRTSVIHATRASTCDKPLWTRQALPEKAWLR